MDDGLQSQDALRLESLEEGVEYRIVGLHAGQGGRFLIEVEPVDAQAPSKLN